MTGKAAKPETAIEKAERLRMYTRPTPVEAPLVDSLVDNTILPVDSKLTTFEMVDSHQSEKVDSRKGDRHSKNKAQYNNWIDAEVFKEIKVFCARMGMTRQEFAELSAIHYMRAVDNHQRESVDSYLAHDDRRLMMGYQTELTIINLYLQYNPQNKWKPKDDRAGVGYNQTDIRLVELGIIETQINASFKRVHSFTYYTYQIDFWIENTPAEMLDGLIVLARRRWQLAKEGK